MLICFRRAWFNFVHEIFKIRFSVYTLVDRSGMLKTGSHDIFLTAYEVVVFSDCLLNVRNILFYSSFQINEHEQRKQIVITFTYPNTKRNVGCLETT